MVYNKDPIDKEKAIEKTYIHLQGLKKKWYQVINCDTSWPVTTPSTRDNVQAKYKHEVHYKTICETQRHLFQLAYYLDESQAELFTTHFTREFSETINLW